MESQLLRLLQGASGRADNIYFSVGTTTIPFRVAAGGGSLVPETYQALKVSYTIPYAAYAQSNTNTDPSPMPIVSLQKTGAVIPLTATAQH